MAETIYKVCSRTEWEDAVRRGVYRGSADDARDGFIHFSRIHQLEGTLQKYFAGRTDLVLISFEADELGPALRYEPSRGGDLFPHLYGELKASLAARVMDLTWDEELNTFVNVPAFTVEPSP